jgi:hypothetical protein
MNPLHGQMDRTAKHLYPCSSVNRNPEIRQVDEITHLPWIALTNPRFRAIHHYPPHDQPEEETGHLPVSAHGLVNWSIRRLGPLCTLHPPRRNDLASTFTVDVFVHRFTDILQSSRRKALSPVAKNRFMGLGCNRLQASVSSNLHEDIGASVC